MRPNIVPSVAPRMSAVRWWLLVVTGAAAAVAAALEEVVGELVDEAGNMPPTTDGAATPKNDPVSSHEFVFWSKSKIGF